MGRYRFSRKLLVGVAALATVGLVGVAASPSAIARSQKFSDATIYDSTLSPLPGNEPSQAFQATQTSEFGNQIVFGGTARVLSTVVVTMSSWGCQSGSQSVSDTGTIDSPTPGSCVTTPGTTFTEPVTFNIYNVGPNNAVGSLITTATQTFNIPFRPSAVPVGYGPNPTGGCGDGASWFDARSDACYHGLATNITFNFGHVVVPDTVVYGIAYNTSGYGAHPYGYATACNASPAGCGYDSLNVLLSQQPLNPGVGLDPNLGTVYWNTVTAGWYCDDGAGGTGTFRIDGRPDSNNCWDGGASTGWSVNSPGTPPYYIPAVQFNAVSGPHAIITSPNHASVVAGTPFSFTITTTGVPTPSIHKAGKLPKGLVFTDLGNGTATISGVALTTDRNGNYRVTLRAANLPGGGRNRQTLTLSLSGGKGK